MVNYTSNELTNIKDQRCITLEMKNLRKENPDE